MTPRQRLFLQSFILLLVIGGWILLFPGALKFVKMAARELRYFWWLILLVALALWLIWGFRRRS